MVTGDTVNHRGAEAQRVRRGGIRAGVGVVAALVLLLGLVSCTEGHGESLSQQQEWPSAGDVWQALSLRDYNTRIVVMGTAGLGMAAGIIGCFMLLRKRALLGDALSHATYPGIGLAFMLTASAGSDEKSLPALLAGAVIAGLAGVLTILAIRRFTRLKEDVALGIVLSVFFGLGVVFDGIIQHMAVGGKAGLASFIYGKTAAMLVEHAQVIGITAAVVAAISVVLYKEFRLLCFDEAFAASQGWPTLLLDLLLMAMVTAVTVVGLKAVGLILIIALLIIPAAAARFWTQRLATMMVIAAGIGAASGFLGAVASRIFDKLPAGRSSWWRRRCCLSSACCWACGGACWCDGWSMCGWRGPWASSTSCARSLSCWSPRPKAAPWRCRTCWRSGRGRRCSCGGSCTGRKRPIWWCGVRAIRCT